MCSQTCCVYFSLVMYPLFLTIRQKRIPKRRKFFNMYFMLYVHVEYFNIFLVKQCTFRTNYSFQINFEYMYLFLF